MATSTLYLIAAYLSGVVTPFLVWYAYTWFGPEEFPDTQT